MKKILFVVNNPAFFLSHRLNIALEAKAQGYRVIVSTMDGAAVATIKAHGFEHVVFPMRRSGMNPVTELASIWALYKIFKQVKPDLVHLVTIKPVLYGGIAARLAGIKAVVYAISGMGFLFTGERSKFELVSFITRQLYRLALAHSHSRVIVQNTTDRVTLQEMTHLKDEQLVLIRGSGADLNRYHYLPEPPTPPVVVTMAARLLRDKGVREFVKAARLTKAHGRNDIIWQLAGSPDPGNPASISEGDLLEWQDDICYVGEVEDIAKLYSQSHIITLPSYREGLPKSLVEAAACGRAVVTTDVPGCRDAIETGVTGLLVEVCSAEALYAAVLRLADDEELRQSMGRAGHQLAVEEFDEKLIAKKQVALYKELLNQ
ncbi:N,N'-diacetylbacillosaminyl-diphospho-undecaprenol alpha-1,3-N-acetylgalactosaminyltransferase [Oligella sp. MSHR50489EDL]|uniref:glycosyltransferase family 4 protein n=1 Tax=Oligella sp. MSHR50489EDL TaxID=3139409 RepID=UPI003D813290